MVDWVGWARYLVRTFYKEACCGRRMGQGERTRTYGDVSLQVAHDGRERGVLEEFCRGVGSW